MLMVRQKLRFRATGAQEVEPVVQRPKGWRYKSRFDPARRRVLGQDTRPTFNRTSLSGRWVAVQADWLPGLGDSVSGQLRLQVELPTASVNVV